MVKRAENFEGDWGKTLVGFLDTIKQNMDAVSAVMWYFAIRDVVSLFVMDVSFPE